MLSDAAMFSMLGVGGMNEILKGREFQFWEYRVSHGSALIRSRAGNGETCNVDILFAGVKYICVPRMFLGIEICDATADEAEAVRKIVDLSNRDDNIYILRSGIQRHRVVAAHMWVDINDMEIMASPFIDPA